MAGTRTTLIAAAAVALAACQPSPDEIAVAHQATLDRYCSDCHNGVERVADLVLEEAGLGDPAARADTFEKVVHKLRLGLMPPPGGPRPETRVVRELVDYLVQSLDAAAAADPRPGRMPLHRLNRAQYANAIRDLLGLELDVESLLPADSSSHGFDNISDVLVTSPLLLERYLTVAMRVAATAVGDTRIEPRTAHYQPPPDLSQNQWIEGLPLGTRGGLVVNHYFPVDGEYEIRPELWAAAASTLRGLEGFETPFELEILIDGVPVHRAPIGGVEDDDLSNRDQGSATAAVNERIAARVPVRSGQRSLAVTFVMKSFAVDQRLLQPFNNDLPPGNDAYGWPRILRVLVTGPYDTTGPGDTPVRRNVFSCHPGRDVAEADCAREILERLARRAYSRPVSESDMQTLTALFAEGSGQNGDFERGVQLALARILSGPEFIFRGEGHPEHVAPGEVYAISDVALASRLALFLWSSIPDEELLELAIAGRLDEPAVLEQQVRRMLADPRARTLVSHFAMQWLQLAGVRNKSPDLLVFPDFDANLRHDMLRQTELFLESVLLGDRSVIDLIDADYTFLNERLARHYGLEGVYGDAFRRVSVNDPHRRGLLGHASVLFETSVANRTSPVFRGNWIMANIFNAPPPPPPPDVPELDESADPAAALTVRERLERHNADPVCASCHDIMDPPGYALEHFDPLGRWRETDAGRPVDSRAELPDGTDISSPAALGRAIAGRPDILADTVTQKLMTYALARGLEAEDLPVVRDIVRAAAREDYRFSTIVLGIVNSKPFRMRQKPPEEPVREAREAGAAAAELARAAAVASARAEID